MNASVPLSQSSQNVSLSATVSSAAGPVNEGTVTFTVFDAENNQVGQPVTSGTVASGAASANFTVPAGQTFGTYTTLAVYNPGPDFNANQQTGTLTIVQPAPVVESIVIDGGAVQRSMVTSITVTFNEVVSLSSGAIEVVQKGGKSEGLVLNESVVNGESVVSIAFTGSDIIGGSLADGDYTLTVNAADVHDQSGQAMANNASDAFWRLFGDARGTGFVDALDYQMFLTAEKTQTMVSIFDYYGTGVVDMTDLAQFLQRFGKHA
jgi:hypothetical protein